MKVIKKSLVALIDWSISSFINRCEREWQRTGSKTDNYTENVKLKSHNTEAEKWAFRVRTFFPCSTSLLSHKWGDSSLIFREEVLLLHIFLDNFCHGMTAEENLMLMVGSLSICLDCWTIWWCGSFSTLC